MEHEKKNDNKSARMLIFSTVKIPLFCAIASNMEPEIIFYYMLEKIFIINFAGVAVNSC